MRWRRAFDKSTLMLLLGTISWVANYTLIAWFQHAYPFGIIVFSFTIMH